MNSTVFHAIAGIRQALAASRADGKRIGFVPTMGALHAGHAQLLEQGRQNCDVLVASIFVNPLQFDRREDYELYARTLPRDLELCGKTGVDMVFAPDQGEMYGSGVATFVEVSGLGDHYCGRSRPGHFRGVATVVAKLFHIIEPRAAWFGEKDAQQLAIIRRMVADLNFPIAIVGVETVREEDGLALSSRNVRLSPEERRKAPAIYRALRAVEEAVESGETSAVSALARGLAILEQAGIAIDYFDLADPATMAPITQVRGPARAMAAAWLGRTRLIDNLLCIRRK